MSEAFFQDWDALIRTAVVGVLAYIALIAFLRISGKRTLSKMNAFDFVVTVALGSTLATILLNHDVSLAEGTVALALLVGLQYVITWTSVRLRWVRRLVTGDPEFLYFRGEMQQTALHRTRVTEDEVRAAVRSSGFASMHEVEAVILETDGTFSVVKRSGEDRSALDGVREN